MKKIMILLTFFSHFLFAQNEISRDQFVDDQSNLLSYTFEKRMEKYLESFYKKQDVKLHILFLQTLKGKDLETYTNDLLNLYDPADKVVIFTLSLADRIFNISRSESLSDDISNERINNMVSVLTPYIKAKRFEQSIVTFSDMAIFSIDDSYNLSPPPIVQKKFQTNIGLLFFLIIFIIVVMLGRKLFSSSLLYTSVKSKIKRKQIYGDW